MKNLYILPLITILILVQSNIKAQTDVLNLFGISHEIIYENGFVVTKDSGEKLKLEKDINNRYFNKIVVEISDGLGNIHLYNTNPQKDQLKNIADSLFLKFGNDNDGKKNYTKRDLENFDYGFIDGRMWKLDANTAIMLNYFKDVQFLNDYGGLVLDIYFKDNSIKYSDFKNKELDNDSDNKEFSFRKTNWGMSKTEIQEIEGSPDIVNEDYLVYNNQTIGGKYNAKIYYIFVDSKLVRAKYIVDEDHTNKNDYINDFLSIKELLSKKYGEPLEEQKNWKNDLYKGDSQNYGTAISIGHLSLLYIWRTSTTDITAYLSGDNFEILNQIEYKSRLLDDVEKKKTEEKILDDF